MFENLLSTFALLVGFAALVTVIVAFAKRAGLPDGRAGQLAAALNLVGLIGLFVAQTWFPDLDVMLIDAQLASFAGVLEVVGAYVLMILTSDTTYQVASNVGLPGGYSHY